MPFYIFMQGDWKEMFVRSVVDHCRVVRCEEGEALHSCMSDLQQCQLPGMTWKICWRLHSIVWTRWKHLPATWRNPSQQVFCLTVWTDQSCTVAASRILFGAGSSLQSVMFVRITILYWIIRLVSCGKTSHNWRRSCHRRNHCYSICFISVSWIHHFS